MKIKVLVNRQRFEVFKRESYACQYCVKSAVYVISNIDQINPFNNSKTHLLPLRPDCRVGKSGRKGHQNG